MLIEALLIVLIILVIAGMGLHLSGYVSHCWKGSADSTPPAAAEKMTAVPLYKSKAGPGELAALNENAEYYTSVAGEGSGAPHGAENFGGVGATYDDYLTFSAIDQQVVKNHNEFVKDRMASNSQNILGRTYSPDSHDSYDPIPWQGLRRPQAVPVSNPTQVPDVDHDLYTNKPTFTWRSS